MHDGEDALSACQGVTEIVPQRPLELGHGLLGFSNGGYLAVANAARDPRVAALVVLYSGIPGVLHDQISRLPPLLALHGDADRTVPLSEGQALVAVARAGGAPAELIVYRNPRLDLLPCPHMATYGKLG